MMKLALQSLFAVLVLACSHGEASAQWWVGGHSYSLRVDKYDSFHGEARPTLWSVERPPEARWLQMLAPKPVIHARMYNASSGYPAIYHAGYPSPYHRGLPAGDAPGYQLGYPVGYPVDAFADESHAVIWRTPGVQVDPLPGDRDLSVPYPAEDSPQALEPPPLPSDTNRP